MASRVAGLSVLFALLASDGGLVVSLTGVNSTNVPASALITALSFAVYLLARLLGPQLVRRRRSVRT